MEGKIIDKPFKTVKEQIEILKARNLLFNDEKTATNLTFEFSISK